LGKKRRRKQQSQLDMAVATIQRRYGSTALLKGRSSKKSDSAKTIPHISTGFPRLDRALAIGGLPKGRVCEILGPTTSGKTTLALKFLVQAQKAGGQVAYIDQALYFDPDYAYRCGLDLSRLLVGKPRDLEESLAMIEALAHNSGLTVLVFDAPDFFWTAPHAAPRLAATLNRLPNPLSRSGTILLALHDATPAASPAGQTPASHSPALSALAHCATMRLQVIREGWIKRHNHIHGYEARVEILKNRLGPDGRKVTLAIKFNGTVRGNGL
jgi:recombination protein RecA